MQRVSVVVRLFLKKWITFSLPQKEKFTMYLTFDDSPDPDSTPKILNLLDKYKAKASFFVTGENATKFPHLIEMINNEEHAIHLHSFYHKLFVIRKLKSLKEDLRRCKNLINSQIYRPPYGKLSPCQIYWLKKNGYRIILWSVNTLDYSEKHRSKERVVKSLDRLKNGDIILLHDKHITISRTTEILEILLEHFSKRNVNFDKIV